MLKSRYSDFYTDESHEGCHVVLKVKGDSKPKKSKAPAGASEEEKAKVKEDNAAMKVKLAELAEEVGNKLSIILSEFIGAPIRKALTDLKEENKETYTIEIPYRKNEKYWVKKADSSVTVLFSLHFTDPTDIALTKILCNEFKDVKKISSQAISVNYYSRLDQESETISDLNVDPKKASCGVISFTLTSIHVKKNLEVALYFLTTFRQYVEFHVRMAKCLLHSRMRKRIGKFEIVFEKALREGVHKKLEYKDNIGGAMKSDKPEEEKISEMSSKRTYKEEHVIGED